MTFIPDLSTVKFGLMLTVFPFTAIILFIAMWWALVDISLRKLPGQKRLRWTLLVILAPPIGTLLYHFKVRRMGELA